jgi:creatinine amidohydrolase
MARRFDWAEYRTTEFEGLDPAQVIAVLPTAAIEQHGPHLPVGTDTMIASGMLDQLRRDCPDDLDLRILPVQAVGKSNEHLHAPGTLTLGADVALKAWVEIGLSVARAGVLMCPKSSTGTWTGRSISTPSSPIKCRWSASTRRSI